MSSSSTQTGYTVLMMGNISSGQINMLISDGWTDEFALSLQNALAGLDWPAGMSFSVTKTETNILNSTAAGTPAAFT